MAGGTPNLSRIAEPYLEKMPLEDLETTLEPLLKAWQSAGGRSSFGDFVVKSGRDTVQQLLEAGAGLAGPACLRQIQLSREMA